MATTSKKRKRDDERVSLALSTQPARQIGPVLANFPCVEPSKSTSFRCYLNKKSGDELVSFAEQHLLVAGENDAVEFFSSEETFRASSGCRYLVGVHNKRTGSTTLRPAPMHLLTRQVKALKALQPAAVSTLERLEARAALGETFGTRKAMTAIKAQERNKIDVAAMEGVAGHLQDSIERGTMALPTQEEAKATADSARLIPPYNVDAQLPQDVYPLHGIIPEPEWRVLSVSALESAQNDGEREALLPYKRSRWVKKHLHLACAGHKPKRNVLKILIYISSMFAFRFLAARKQVDKTELQEKLQGVPSVVVDGFIARFTESARGSTTVQTTSSSETMILTHMFALCLRVEDFAADAELLAADLSMAVPRINQLFKSLGCKVSKLTVTDIKRLGLPEDAGEIRRAMLHAPVEFPKVRARRQRM